LLLGQLSGVLWNKNRLLALRRLVMVPLIHVSSRVGPRQLPGL
jgi:hypothetical protein